MLCELCPEQKKKSWYLKVLLFQTDVVFCNSKKIREKHKCNLVYLVQHTLCSIIPWAIALFVLYGLFCDANTFFHVVYYCFVHKPNYSFSNFNLTDVHVTCTLYTLAGVKFSHGSAKCTSFYAIFYILLWLFFRSTISKFKFQICGGCAFEEMSKLQIVVVLVVRLYTDLIKVKALDIAIRTK